jgi:excisionase family DNA binding protein
MSILHPTVAPTTPLLVDAREAARLLAISPRKLWSLTRLGDVPSMRVGRVVRYRISDLDEWTRARTEDQSGRPVVVRQDVS